MNIIACSATVGEFAVPVTVSGIFRALNASTLTRSYPTPCRETTSRPFAFAINSGVIWAERASIPLAAVTAADSASWSSKGTRISSISERASNSAKALGWTSPSIIIVFFWPSVIIVSRFIASLALVAPTSLPRLFLKD
jgi:hypothetical protein